MPTDTVDISNLSAGQRVALMERLWRSLAYDVESQGPPAWHEEELESRRDEWAERGSVAEEWSRVRADLRRLPYWIYYRIEGDSAYVVAVLDARQDPGKIEQREKIDRDRTSPLGEALPHHRMYGSQ